MSCRILILGGYGNFGKIIAQSLAQTPGISLIIAGRSPHKAKNFAARIGAAAIGMDINHDLDQTLRQLKPDIVIHTCGPFQGQSYTVAQACIRHRAHYIDIADGRDFVCNIIQLNDAAQQAGLTIVSGASSVPALTSAIIETYRHAFTALTTLDYSISTAQRTNPGLATTEAICGYVGKPFTTRQNGTITTIYGWQDLTHQTYPELGKRWLANCDVPDLALFPQYYQGLRDIRFHAGLEVPLLHIGLWSLSWLVRAGLLPSLKPFASLMYKAARLFDRLGTDRSGFHMCLSGTGPDGNSKSLTAYLITGSGHGPHIPCVPAIILARRLAAGTLKQTGAFPCMGLITLADYLDELKGLDIQWYPPHTP